jgi:hypothetical protein
MSYSYKKIQKKAKECKDNVKGKYKLGISTKWSYYFAKAIIYPNKDVKKIKFDKASDPKQSKMSRQLSRVQYKQVALDLVSYVEKHKKLPNYVRFGNYKIKPRLLTYAFAKVLLHYKHDGKYPSEITFNSKVFTKPLETSNKEYEYFCKVFNGGKKIKTIDEGLKLIQGRGYGYYYDDQLSNKQVIDHLKNGGLKPNCTDSCQMAYNLVLQLIEWKVYKKVECLHVQCSSGGHVKLRITKNDGSTFIRDVACIISDNGKPLTCVWCTNQGTVNPSWFMENLNR